MNKSILIVGIFLISTSLSTGCQTDHIREQEEPLSSSNSQTSDWISYIDESYGYSFEYPGDWIIKEDKNFKPSNVKKSSVHHVLSLTNGNYEDQDRSNSENISFSIKIYNKDTNTPIDIWLKENITTTLLTLESTEEIETTRNTISINSKVSSRDTVDIQKCEPAWEREIFVDGGAWVYKLDLSTRIHQSIWLDLIGSFEISGFQQSDIDATSPIVFDQYYCNWTEDDPRMNQLFQ